MQLRSRDAVVIIAYLVFMLLIGVWGRRKAKTKESFLVADRNLGFWILFPCVCALLLGGGSTVGATGLGYTYGLSGVWFLVSLALGVAVLAIIAPRVSRLRIYTIAEMLSLRFGESSKMFGAVVIAVYLVLLSVVQIVSVGSILSVLFGWDPIVAMLVGGGIGILYSYLGGMVAITFTDVVQWFFMTAGIFFILLPSALSRAGGFAGLMNSLPPESFNLSTIGGASILAYFLLYTLGSPVDQSGWHRLFTAKSTKVAVGGSLATAGYAIIWGFAIMLIGMSAAVIMPGIENPDSVFTMMAIETLPAGVAGIVLAAALSAIMSTMSGPFLAASTTIINDFIVPYQKEKASDEKVVQWTRLCLILSGIAGLIIAFWLQGILIALNFAYEILAASLVVPIFFGLYWKRANSKGSLASIIAGVIGVVAGLFIFGIDSLWPIVSGLGCSLVAMVVVSLSTPPEPEKIERLNARAIAQEGAVE